MDVLSEVLRAVRLEGALFFHGEFTAPWCFTSAKAAEIAPFLCPRQGRLVVYHFLTQGRAYAKLPEGGRRELTAGDIVVFPHGDLHLLGNGAPVKPVDSFKTFELNLTEGRRVARYGGGGEVTRFVCGYMVCEPRLSEVIFAGLPPMLKVHLGEDAAGQWLADTIRFTVGEVEGSVAGSGLVLAKLSEVLFVETLRRFINGLPQGESGWLAGARDPAVSRVLALMHKEPAREWTIAGLAKGAGLSRSRLAERFARLLGQTPMAYLAQWRLKLGAEMLCSSEENVAEIAASVGYGSEAAFNRAFRREHGLPPAHFRRKHQASGTGNGQERLDHAVAATRSGTGAGH